MTRSNPASPKIDRRIVSGPDHTDGGRKMLRLTITLVALVMLVAIVTPVFNPILMWLLGGALPTVERALVVAILLNAALLLLAGRYYFDSLDRNRSRAAAENRIHVLAYRDPLTGLHNRHAMGEEARALLGRTSLRDRAIALMVIDLDHFKQVNDVHGHLIGDMLLKAVSASITAVLPRNAIAARLGGDEFAVLMPFAPDLPETVRDVAENIVSRLNEPFNLNGIMAHVGGSIGIARTDPDCLTIDALLRRADIAMYGAKRGGRGRYLWFDASMDAELKTRDALEQGLRLGIPAGQLVPFYEPQIALATGALSGFEVLARWHHPSSGMILPDQFINVAEECGLIGDLSMAVMRQAMLEARDWDPGLALSVNISPIQLKDPWLAQKIVLLLGQTGFPARRLEIEITESSLFENLSLAQSIVGSLKNQGIRVALDDFGTGYSSLAHLRALPFDRIKIDRSFVQSILTNGESSAIVTAITKLAESLSLPVTAEGVESAEIEAALKALGAEQGQGWHFGKAMSAADARAYIGSHLVQGPLIRAA